MLVDGFLRAASLSCVIGAAIIAVSTGPVTAATIEVTVSGVIPHGGSVLTTLCDGGLDGATCAQGQSQPASATVVTFAFQGIEPGRYADPRISGYRWPRRLAAQPHGSTA